MEWTMLAQQSGFKTTEIIYQNDQLQNSINAENSLQSILVFNEKCYGDGRNNFVQAAACCVSLGKLCNEKILEIWFYDEDGNTLFVSAGTQPSFKNVTPDFIHDVNKLLYWFYCTAYQVMGLLNWWLMLWNKQQLLL